MITIKFADTFIGNGDTEPIDIKPLSLSSDFVGDGENTPLGIKPLYLSNNFKGSGSTIADPLTLDNLKLIPIKTPAKSTSPGIIGEICRDNKYLYQYIASTATVNRWVKVAFSTTNW